MKQRLALMWLVSSLLLTGCATETVFRPAASTSSTARDQAFNVSGRISVNMDGKGSVGQFDWAHQPDADQLSVNSPLGTTVARLQRNPAGVSLQADGKTWQATDVESLTQDVLGWTLPLGNLVWWIRGLPAPDAPYQFSADGSLAQQGWTIRFVSDADVPSLYPKRVDMQRDRLTVRLLPQSWH
ncbi:lipoprotein insertase outer membrane protein LolB [Aquitalea sp. ASV11]|uniref:lipoprotein insertase outer membrane protein LolB n=1 Tax=Aquitalea sp. ASV11 TaxID=2795103 RepID=UPI0018EC5408|nr:lipoprotein insertase outer membrane protein LolB [Aquitalea sp. ASV11]